MGELGAAVAQSRRRPHRVCCCCKPHTELVTFNGWQLQQAMLFHLIYHHSLALHLNHLLFLHTYLFGAYLLAATSENIFVLAVVAGSFGLYICILGRPIFLLMLPYLVFTAGGLPLAAWKLAQTLLLTLAWPFWPRLGLPLALIFGSFACQLLGHWLHELFNAPPSLLHGFVAAPILEYVSLLWRLGVTKGDRDAVRRESDACRDRAFCLHRELVLKQLDE